MTSNIDTSNIDAVSRPPLSRPVDREKRSFLPWISIAAVFAAAMLLRQVVPLNVDVSWLLVIGERVLDGQRLYVDIVEINPPMAVFAYLPGIALARAIGLDTVKLHVRHILTKLNLTSRVEAAVFAVEYRNSPDVTR